MELVHHNLIDIGVLAVTQRNIRHDLGGGSNDQGVAVHGGITSHHAHILGAKDLTQGKELLTHQRLDRGGVKRALATRHGNEMGHIGHHRLASRSAWPG